MLILLSVGMQVQTLKLCLSLTADAVCVCEHFQCWSTLYNIFNVDPHYTGMDANVEHNIEKGEFCWDKEFGITIPSHNGQNNFILVLLTDEWS